MHFGPNVRAVNELSTCIACIPWRMTLKNTEFLGSLNTSRRITGVICAVKKSNMPKLKENALNKMELSHNPRTVKELQNATATVVEDFVFDANSLPFELTTNVAKRQYGAKVEIAWWSPRGEYCRCHAANCPEVQHGKFPFRDVLFRVTSDTTFELFKAGLEWEIKFMRSLIPKNSNSDSETE